MIIDCCLFSGETLHLLIRLRELAGVVDRFVVAESTTSFQGEAKVPVLPRLLEQGLGPYTDLVTPVIVDDVPLPGGNRGGLGTNMFMRRERHVRDAMQRGLPDDLADTDVVLYSDVDEIPRVSAVEEAAQRLRDGADMLLFQQRMHVWSRRWLWPGPSWDTCATLGRRHGPQVMRDMRGVMIEAGDVVEDAGWHLTWMGGEVQNRRKLLTFSHAEHLSKLDRLGELADRGVDINGVDLVPVDVAATDWPQWFRDHPGVWA